MKYIFGVCCLLFTIPALAGNAYFEGYVTIKSGHEGSQCKGSVCHQRRSFRDHYYY